jgi:hypothetical protein
MWLPICVAVALFAATMSKSKSADGAEKFGEAAGVAMVALGLALIPYIWASSYWTCAFWTYVAVGVYFLCGGFENDAAKAPAAATVPAAQAAPTPVALPPIRPAPVTKAPKPSPAYPPHDIDDQAWAAIPRLRNDPAPAAQAPLPPVCVALKKLQAAVDAVPAGQRCELGSGEYLGPCTVSRPVAIRGSDDKRASVVGADGRTALTVASAGVALSGINVEAADGALAIEKPAELAVGLANVVVRGRTSGFGDEDKEWVLPASVDVSAGGSFRISVPVGVRVVSKVDAIGLPNAEYPPGEHEIAMDLSEMGKGALVFGYFHVVSPSFIRRIHVTGRIARDG